MNRIAKSILFTFILLINNAIVVNSSSALIPIPTDRQSWSYAPFESPVLNDDPSQARPVGVGSIATGGETLSVHVALEQFEGAADVYGAYINWNDPQTVHILNPNGVSLSTFTINQIINALATGNPPAAAQPWKSNTTGPIDEQLINTSIANIPSGTYTVYLLVTPTGSLSSYYLWITTFNDGGLPNQYAGSYEGTVTFQGNGRPGATGPTSGPISFQISQSGEVSAHISDGTGWEICNITGPSVFLQGNEFSMTGTGPCSSPGIQCNVVDQHSGTVVENVITGSGTHSYDCTTDVEEFTYTANKI
jgi:hypothetical protein